MVVARWVPASLTRLDLPGSLAGPLNATPVLSTGVHKSAIAQSTDLGLV
jgi:hypothetical protein